MNFKRAKMNLLRIWLLAVLLIFSHQLSISQEAGMSEELQKFLTQVRVKFIEPLQANGVRISNVQRAKIIGYALQLQSRYAGSNPSKQESYRRLRSEVQAFLELISPQQSLWTIAVKAERGQANAEIGVLFSGKPVKMDSVLAEFDIPLLRADVTRINFYEGGSNGVPYRERNYGDRFFKSSTRFIWWELNLKHPSPRQQINFKIEARYYRPDGILLGQLTTNTYIRPGWTNSYHQQAWGWKAPGNWPLGTHRVDLLVEGRKVASKTFQITAVSGIGLAVDLVPGFKARVKSLKFFESGSELVPYQQRVYREKFSRSKTRYIYWEWNLEHPDPGRKIDFTIYSVWYKPDGSKWTETSIKSVIMPGWKHSWHASSWGWENPGNWLPGTYRVEILVGGKRVASGVFKIE